jgi:hypothetical protein
MKMLGRRIFSNSGVGHWPARTKMYCMVNKKEVTELELQ